MENIKENTIIELTAALNQVSEILKDLRYKKTNIQEEEKLIKPEEAMKILKVGRNTMYCDLLTRENFPCMKIGRNIYINKEGLKNWINNECKK